MTALLWLVYAALLTVAAVAIVVAALAIHQQINRHLTRADSLAARDRREQAILAAHRRIGTGGRR